MALTATLLDQLKALLPALIAGPLLLIPFIVAEQIRPVGPRPGWRDYGMNILISSTTLVLSLPLGLLAGQWSGQIRQLLPWKPLAPPFAGLSDLPVAGPVLQVAAVVLVSFLLHDLWFYWAHRIEHRVPFLWEFHKLHHSDERMNSATSSRDHFLQAGWIAFFPAFTAGLIFDLSLAEAGQMAVIATLALTLWSMFYHSALKVRLPWLDRVLVTPQVHRIHHSIDPAHHNRNFADILPIFDILFGTYHRPGPDEFPQTGLGPAYPAPRHILAAQFGPVVAAIRTLAPKRRPPAVATETP